MKYFAEIKCQYRPDEGEFKSDVDAVCHFAKKHGDDLIWVYKEIEKDGIVESYKDVWKEDDEDDEGCKCKKCGGAGSYSPHTCPYKEDVGGDSTTLCNCCSNCRRECAMDV